MFCTLALHKLLRTCLCYRKQEDLVLDIVKLVVARQSLSTDRIRLVLRAVTRGGTCQSHEILNLHRRPASAIVASQFSKLCLSRDLHSYPSKGYVRVVVFGIAILFRVVLDLNNILKKVKDRERRVRHAVIGQVFMSNVSVYSTVQHSASTRICGNCLSANRFPLIGRFPTNIDP